VPLPDDARYPACTKILRRWRHGCRLGGRHRPAQFEVMIHVDETHALQPLETWALHETDVPETYPTGI